MAQEGLVLTKAQLAALEKAKTEKEAHGEFESEHPGYCGAQDSFIDTKVAFANLYDRKTPITAAGPKQHRTPNPIARRLSDRLSTSTV